MKMRPRTKHSTSFSERLASEAKRLKQLADETAAGGDRELILLKIREVETALQIVEWTTTAAETKRLMVAAEHAARRRHARPRSSPHIKIQGHEDTRERFWDDRRYSRRPDGLFSVSAAAAGEVGPIAGRGELIELLAAAPSASGA